MNLPQVLEWKFPGEPISTVGSGEDARIVQWPPSLPLPTPEDLQQWQLEYTEHIKLNPPKTGMVELAERITSDPQALAALKAALQ